jgi:ABC-type antimicrobial peptide transport system permease subunit
MRQRTAEATGRRRFQTVVLAGFAAAALLLSLIGLYGLLSYSVRQRMGEIGVRIALGARRGTVTGMFVRQGLRLTLVGLALGVAISGILAGLISGMLFGVRALDPTTFALVPLCMLTTAAVASFVPARRAARIDPVRALGRN